MPELPEVEVIVRGLRAGVCGRQVVSVDAPWPTSVRGGADRLRELAVGREIRAVRRRAKLALFELDSGAVLAAHLKMTGRLMVRRAGQVCREDPYLRVALTLSDGGVLTFSDVRRFGYLAAFAPGELASWDFWAGLGPEPLELAPEAFAERLAGRKAQIKALLLNQQIVAGIGNIYADESLFRAGIRPDRRASELSRAQLKRLGTCLRKVLEQAIRENGSSIRDYRDANGNAGAFQNSFNVYGRGGETCPRCGTTLVKGRVAGRGTTWCPECQR